MSEKSRREIMRFRTSEALNASRSVLKDTDNVLRQSQVLGDAATAFVEEL